MPILHSHSGTPETTGIIIHQAKLYDLVFNPLLKLTEGRIIGLARVKPGDSVLDLGCGPGSLTRAAKTRAGKEGKVCGIDASPEMIAVAQRRARQAGLEIDFQQGLAENLPYPDATFDVVLSRLVLHHLPGDLARRGFKEMRRVLKPGGYCLAVDLDHNAPLHKGISSIEKYRPLLEEAGFSRIETGKAAKFLLTFIRGSAA